MKQRKSVIIGLDGVPYELLVDLASKGIMPATKTLIEQGTIRRMHSSIPEVSSVAWSSIITGANPAEHGIFGFTDFAEQSYRLTFPNFNNLHCRPFWEREGDRRHIIVNVPATFPARELNGILIAGFVALDLERAVFPKTMLPELQKIEYRVDADLAKAHKSMELFVTDLVRTNEARIKAYRYLWQQPWDTFMFVFTGTDRLLHFLWDAYKNAEHRFHHTFIEYFKRIDEVIGEMLSRIDTSTDFLLISDHGFEELQHEFYVNSLLLREGFLKFKDIPTPTIMHIDHDTKAFALDPARMYVNLTGKYPCGSVAAADRQAVIRDLEQLLSECTYHGEKVITHIYRKEEIFRGPLIERAPDLVLIGNTGFNLKAAIKPEVVFTKGIFTGKHTAHNAVFIAKGKFSDRVIPNEVTVSDILAIRNRIKETAHELQIA